MTTTNQAANEREEIEKLREDILLKLTGDSFGEELYVDTKAKYIADDLMELIKAHDAVVAKKSRIKADQKTLEVIAALLNGDHTQVEVVLGYIRNKLKMYVGLEQLNTKEKKS